MGYRVEHVPEHHYPWHLFRLEPPHAPRLIGQFRFEGEARDVMRRCDSTARAESTQPVRRA